MVPHFQAQVLSRQRFDGDGVEVEGDLRGPVEPRAEGLSLRGERWRRSPPGGRPLERVQNRMLAEYSEGPCRIPNTDKQSGVPPYQKIHTSIPYLVRRLQARDLPPCAPARQEVEGGVRIGADEVGPPHEGTGAAHAGLGLEHGRL